jgi:hypothetical protein
MFAGEIIFTDNSDPIVDTTFTSTVDSLMNELKSANDVIKRDSLVIEEFKKGHYDKVDSIKSRSIIELYGIWSSGARLDSFDEAPQGLRGTE